MHPVHLAALLAETANAAAPIAGQAADHVTKAAPHGIGGAIHHFADAILHFLKPFGAWGLGGLSLFDSALLPLPVPVDGIVAGYVAADPHRFLLYAFVAAVFSAIGSLLPFYVGRLGGELFLLGKINRERYERLRDRFERQEFLAIMLPAMSPPPMPIKLFEFSAGVFEMKTATFLLAMFLGKLIQFLFFAVLTYVYGPRAMQMVTGGLRNHGHLVMIVAGVLLVVVLIWVVRKLFDRRRGTTLPMEDEASEGVSRIVEE